MKRYIYLLTVAVLAAFSCTVTGPEEEAHEYAGNRVKVTLEDNIPVTGGSVKAKVQSEIPFTVSIPEAAAWLKAQATDTEITFTAATANESAEMRYASVALIDAEKGFAITRFDVCQDGVGMAEKKPFEVSNKEINVEADVTTASFDITTEVAWTVTSSNEAFVASPASGEGNATVTVTFPANEGAEAVVAELSVASEDPLARPKSHTVVITQASNVKKFVVTAGKTELAHTDQYATISIESDVAWTITSSNEKFVFTNPRYDKSAAPDEPKVTTYFTGEGTKEIQILVPANFTYEDVKTTITVVTEDPWVLTEKTVAVDFTQAAYTIPTGQVLAEWYFAKSETDKLKSHWNLVADSGGDSEKEGWGYPEDLYVDACEGNGKLKYWQVDKLPIVDKVSKRCKRTITSVGEPMVVPPYTGDYALWTATPSDPLAAGTKVHIFFAVRPNDPEICKYWKLQYLDGTEWKVVADQVKTTTTANGSVEYTHELVWTGDQQTNTFVDAVVTLTAETTEVQFKFECVDNTMCDGTAWGDYKVSGALELRFSGWDSTGDANPQYAVLKRPVIEVIQ